MQTLINILVFALVLGSIITIHEFGHFITAKLFGVYCSEFSMGMGPLIFKKQGKETQYSLRLLPIGGYVAMAGDPNEMENEVLKQVPFERSLPGIAWWKRVIIMVAGVVMNFVLAVLISVSVNYVAGSIYTNSNIIGGIAENGAAEVAGLQAGDEMLAITFLANDATYDITSFEDLGTILSLDSNGLSKEDTAATLKYSRNGEIKTANLVLNYEPTRDSFLLGISAHIRKLTFGEAVKYSFESIGEMATMVFKTLGKLITDTKNVVPQLSGPAGIYEVTAEMTSTGQVANLLMLVAALSVNIGVFNLMPIPGLDGAQILFVLVETAIGRPINDNVKGILTLVGLVLVFGLMIVVTIQDLGKLF